MLAFDAGHDRSRDLTWRRGRRETGRHLDARPFLGVTA
jgi:hypothetical protein